MKHDVFMKFMPVSLAMFTKDRMLYSEYQPCKELNQAINCYWVSPTIYNIKESLCSTKKEIIIPDGCLDIIFMINKQTNEYRSFIVGMMSEPIITIPDFSNSQIYAIRFNPAGAYYFIRNRLSDFTDLMVEFECVSKNLEKELAGILLSEKSLDEKIKCLDSFFLKRFDEWRENAVIMNSLASIFNAKGNMEIKKLALELYVSERHLNRMFKQWIGLSPKEFTRIIRFQNTLRNVLVSDVVEWTSLAIESGYHDQAHFINEFKTFSGITPTQILKLW
ncbi:MAG: transcriptional regulator with only domain, AraC family [Firmicutes bacterium]|nr:transcriptional regulator with only domain, AraC family [Bacillota bacterium]